MKAVGYIRVSSEMQVKQGHSLDMQRQMITDYVQSKGWALSDLFCETAQSGKLIDRPALQMMLDRARYGEFDVIVVTSFDRFYRARIQHRVRCTQPSVSAESVEATIVGLLSKLKWPNDWREQWRQALESAWDEVPLLSDDTQRQIAREQKQKNRDALNAQIRVEPPSEQTAIQRSFEIERLIESLEPLSPFGAQWEIAASAHDALLQKRLLRLALSRVVVRGDRIEIVEASRAFAHLLRNTQIASCVNQIEEEEARLMAQLISRSAT